MNLQKIRYVRNQWLKRGRLKKYLKNNRVPWSEGYDDFKWNKIAEAINDKSILQIFRSGQPLPPGYGHGLDERIVEYPFVFSKLRQDETILLDAGSTFNFEQIVSHPLVTSKDMSIYTFYPEGWNYISKRISYVFGDLRNLPFRDSWFQEVVCISTLEHIGLDNSMYGYNVDAMTATPDESSSYLSAISEMVRVLKGGGQLLMTFPFGKHRNYGFFQQFDSEMVGTIFQLLKKSGTPESTFYKYLQGGWTLSTETECIDAESFNPHTGEGRGSDGAAHSRAICALQFTKYPVG